MAVTTIEEFNDLLLVNGDRGNAENINAAPIQLKSEINEINNQVVSLTDTLASTVTEVGTSTLTLSDHTTLINILKGVNPPDWSPINRPYQKNVYVYHEGNSWKSRRITTAEPQSSSVDWELIRLYASGESNDTIDQDSGLADIYDVYRKDFEVDTDGQTDFIFEEQTDITSVAIFVDGELLKLSEYNLNENGIILNNGINVGQTLTMLYNDFLPVNSNILTNIYDVEVVADQTVVNVKYNPGYEIVYVNGKRISRNQYTTNQSGSYITMKNAFVDGDTFAIQSFGVLVDTKKVFANTYMSLNTGYIDLTQADVFEINVTEDTSFQITNKPTGHMVLSFIIEIVGGSQHLVQWFDGIKWDSGIVPTLSDGRDIYGFYTKDGGSNWRGMLLGKDFK